MAVSPSTQTVPIGTLELACGATLRDAEVAVRIHGDPNAAQDNVVLLPHAYSATPESLDGWIGAGRALDPARLCILCPGQLGGGRSSSPSTHSHEEAFPALAVQDDVAAQERMLDLLLPDARLRLVAGFSMGAQQAYAWAATRPQRVRALCAIAGTARTTARCRRIVSSLATALSDATEAGGATHALRLHAELLSTLATAPRGWRETAWRALGIADAEDFVLRLFVADYAGCDVADLLVQLRKWAHADAGSLARVVAATTVVALRDDALFPPGDCAADRRAIPGSRFVEVDTPWGHSGLAGWDRAATAAVDAELARLLEHDVMEVSG